MHSITRSTRQPLCWPALDPNLGFPFTCTRTWGTQHPLSWPALLAARFRGSHPQLSLHLNTYLGYLEYPAVPVRAFPSVPEVPGSLDPAVLSPLSGRCHTDPGVPPRPSVRVARVPQAVLAHPGSQVDPSPPCLFRLHTRVLSKVLQSEGSKHTQQEKEDEYDFFSFDFMHSTLYP